MKKMRLIYRCAVCGKEIEKPLMNTYTCGNPKCKKKYHAFANWLRKEEVYKSKTKKNINS